MTYHSYSTRDDCTRSTEPSQTMAELHHKTADVKEQNGDVLCEFDVCQQVNKSHRCGSSTVYGCRFTSFRRRQTISFCRFTSYSPPFFHSCRLMPHLFHNRPLFLSIIAFQDSDLNSRIVFFNRF